MKPIILCSCFTDSSFLSFSFGQQLPCSLLLLVLKGFAAAWERDVGSGRGSWLRRYQQEALKCRLWAWVGGRDFFKVQPKLCERMPFIVWISHGRLWRTLSEQARPPVKPKAPKERGPMNGARFVREIVHTNTRKSLEFIFYKQRESTKYFTENQIYLLNSHDDCGGWIGESCRLKGARSETWNLEILEECCSDTDGRRIR